MACAHVVEAGDHLAGEIVTTHIGTESLHDLPDDDGTLREILEVLFVFTGQRPIYVYTKSRRS